MASNSDSNCNEPAFTGKCAIKVPRKVDEVLQWDFEISKRSNLLLKQNSYDFNGLKFRSGLMSGIDHSWSVSITPAYCFISTTMELPEKNPGVGIELRGGELQLWSTEKMKYRQALEFNETPHTKKNFWSSQSRLGETVWNDDVEIIRFILKISVQRVAKCSNITELEVWKPDDPAPFPIAPISIDEGAELLSSGKLSDVTLVCEGTELRAHRLILACRSPVFGAMFGQTEMKEAKEGRVLLKDMDLSTLKRMLEFMYIGEVKALKDNAMELYRIADRFGIEELKCLCSTQLLMNIKSDNAVDIYALASTYKDERLMVSALQILKYNRDAAFKDADTLKEFCTAFPEAMFKIFRSW